MLVLNHWQKKKKNLGEKTWSTNLHENARKSSRLLGDLFYCKVLLLINVPLVWEAEPGGVVGETIVWLFFSSLNQFQCLN